MNDDGSLPVPSSEAIAAIAESPPLLPPFATDADAPAGADDGTSSSADKDADAAAETAMNMSEDIDHDYNPSDGSSDQSGDFVSDADEESTEEEDISEQEFERLRSDQDKSDDQLLREMYEDKRNLNDEADAKSFLETEGVGTQQLLEKFSR